MNNTVTCLKPVVGLVSESCICTEEGRPTDFATSLSQRYIADESHGLPMEKLEKLTFRNDDTVWDWLEDRRRNGTQAFLSDLNLNIPEANRVAFNKYAGFIGDVKEWSYALAGVNAVTGIGLHPKLFRGVQASFRGFRLFYPGLSSGQVDVYRSTDLLKGDTTPFYSLAFSGNVGDVIHVLVPAASPLEIDLCDEYGEPVSIFAVVANGGTQPLNTNFFCGTCGVPSWGKFFTPQNINVADAAALIPIAQNRTVPYGSVNYGIAADLVVECSDSWLCHSMNYSATWPRVMAEALQLYQQRDCYENILRMEAINPRSIFGRDMLAKAIENINTLLATRMVFLGLNIPISLSDCLICNDRIQVLDNII